MRVAPGKAALSFCSSTLGSIMAMFAEERALAGEVGDRITLAREVQVHELLALVRRAADRLDADLAAEQLLRGFVGGDIRGRVRRRPAQLDLAHGFAAA